MKRNSKYLELVDALQVSTFIQSWWKQLKKKVNACNQSKEQKIMIYSKFAKGFIFECLKLAKTEEDFNHIKLEMDEMFTSWKDYPRE